MIIFIQTFFCSQKCSTVLFYYKRSRIAIDFGNFFQFVLLLFPIFYNQYKNSPSNLRN